MGATVARAQSEPGMFALKNNDRVVFYGDSITDQRQYTIMTEDFVVTRFPGQKITFIHSGWGGDRVGGGGGGKIDTRLDRDVTAYKPTVVTVMLGMNDAAYRAYDAGIFQTYTSGYEHLVNKVRTDNPGVRLTLIQPSPYDDVTRAPGFPGGYNATLLRYSGYVRDLAGRTPLAQTADLNTLPVQMLQKANEADNATAQKIIPDRVHPGAGGHLIMAQALLQAWNAPALVSSVSLDAPSAKMTGATNAQISNVKGNANTLSWTCKEGALPFPLNLDGKDAPYTLALKSSDFVQALDQEILAVKGLAPGRYALNIDGGGATPAGTFTSEELAAGVNLAVLPTPMLKQAQDVSALTRKHSNIHNDRWRTYQVPYEGDANVKNGVKKMMSGMDALEADLVKEQRAMAQPKAHTFTLSPVLGSAEFLRFQEAGSLVRGN